MSLHKEFAVVRADNQDNILEEFSTLGAAEKFLIMMQGKGENVMIKTDDNSIEEAKSFDIEGLDIETPSADFGSDLGYFDEDQDPGFEVNDDAPEIDID